MVLAGLLAHGSLASAAEGSVLLWRLKSLGVDAEIAARVESLLGKEMARIEGVTLIGPAALAAAIDVAPELGLCRGQSACLVALGRATGAGRVVSGVLGKLGDTFSLDLKVVDSGSGVETGRLAQTWGGLDDTLIEVMRQVATRALKPEAYLGQVSLALNVDRVKVYIDGDFVGLSPLAAPLQLTPGRHALKLVRQDYRDLERFVDVAFDRLTEVSLQLHETRVRETIETQRAHRWWSLGLKAGLVSNLSGFHAPGCDLEAGLRLPWWSGALALVVQIGVHGMEYDSRSVTAGRDDAAVSGGVLATPIQLLLIARLMPQERFSPYLVAGGGAALVWQRIAPDGFADQAFRDLRGSLVAGGGLEHEIGPGALLLEVRYLHLELEEDSAEGGFYGLLGGLGVSLGYRLRL